VPVALAAETDMLVCPEFVNVSDKLVLLPTWTLPNDRLVGVGDSVPWATPVALSGIVKLGFVPFEVMFTLPVAGPLAVGAKSTVKDVLCPAASVTGLKTLNKLKPVPLALAAKIERLVPPVFVNVSDKLVLLPTWTLPNDRLVGVGVSVPWATPVAVIGMLKLEFVPFEVTLTLPVAAPLAAGAKSTANDALCPGASVTGENPLKLKPAPLALAAETDMLVCPEFVKVSDKLVLLPT
jgi:hypothetical protein